MWPSLGFAVALAVTAMNLRPALTSLPPLMPEVLGAYGLSATSGSTLIALPVFVLGAGSPLGFLLARRFGANRAIVLALLLIALGTGARALSVHALFPGTALAAVGITVISVLLPGVVKAQPASSALLTSVYGLAMALGATVAPVVTGVLADAGVSTGGAIATWAVLPVVAGALWSWAARGVDGGSARPKRFSSRLLRDGRAWAVTAFFGIQASLFFLVVTWLPQFYRDHGGTASHAGLALGIFSGIGMMGSWFVPLIAVRLPSQAGLGLGLSLLGAMGFALLGVGAPPLLAVVCLGIGQAAVFPLVLTLFALRSGPHRSADELSTMAQALGFIGAAIALVLVSWLHANYGSWELLWLGLAGVAVLQACVGRLAGAPGP